MTLRLGPADPHRVRFARSPLFETLAAVRVATGPRPPGAHAPWLREVRPRLRALDLRPLTLLQPRRGYSPDFLSPPPAGPRETFAQGLARLAATPGAQVREEITRSLAETPGAAGSEAGRALLTPPPEAVRAFLAASVRAAWDALLAPYWARVEALLEADLALRSRRLAEGGLEALFSDLHPMVRGRGDLVVRESGFGGDEHRDLAGEGLLLVPSAFKTDEAVVVLDAPWQPTLLYPALGHGTLWERRAGPAPDAALARLLGRTRALLLTALGEPASTSRLSAAHGLALGTVSEHLGVLRAAGLVVRERWRHEVRYRRTELGESLVRGAGP
ncbi:DUF5937 family protein [Streptomyces sp. NPDC007088]|uniref:DUF5937 family protein n=1 Tax=Streptomyces sp. NPDC007088 TaxID=3364773 RepID=UPI0036AD7AE0